jgi:hypothetical protein
VSPHGAELELEALQRSCPLPSSWSIAECLFDAAEVDGLRVELVGLCARSLEGREALGSAGARGSVPVARAYYELCERIAVLEALTFPQATYVARRADGAAERVALHEAFPEAPAAASFRYSRSNGVAAGRSWAEACASAFAELIERDRLLRAWYGETAPVRRPLPEEPALAALEPWYEFEAYAFPAVASEASTLEVAAVFGFPRRPAVALVFGSAAAASLPAAFDGAVRECLQRWGFLWGETIPSEAPGFAPTADYHQELYLWPEMHAPLRRWLAGGHVGMQGLAAVSKNFEGSTCFVDLSPAGGPVVARAVPRAELPLTFGRWHPSARAGLPESLSVHPIA